VPVQIFPKKANFSSPGIQTSDRKTLDPNNDNAIPVSCYCNERVDTALVEVAETQDVYGKSTSRTSYEEMYIRLRDCNIQNLSIGMNAFCFLIAGHGQPSAAKEKDRSTQLLYQSLHIYKMYKIYTLKH